MDGIRSCWRTPPHWGPAPPEASRGSAGDVYCWDEERSQHRLNSSWACQRPSGEAFGRDVLSGGIRSLGSEEVVLYGDNASSGPFEVFRAGAADRIAGVYRLVIIETRGFRGAR